MGWLRVVYGVQFSSPVPFDHTDGFGNSAHADLYFIFIDTVEQYGYDADNNLGSVTIDRREPYVGQKVTVSGQLFDTDGSHTVGPVMLVDTEMNVWSE